MLWSCQVTERSERSAKNTPRFKSPTNALASPCKPNKSSRTTVTFMPSNLRPDVLMIESLSSNDHYRLLMYLMLGRMIVYIRFDVHMLGLNQIGRASCRECVYI